MGSGAAAAEKFSTTYDAPKRPDSTSDCMQLDPVCGVDGVTYWCGCADAHCKEQNTADDRHPKSLSEAVEEIFDEASRSGGVGQWPTTPLLLPSLPATSSSPH
nr:Serine-type endopeptidase inhibitor [Ipomoea batatas]